MMMIRRFAVEAVCSPCCFVLFYPGVMFPDFDTEYVCLVRVAAGRGDEIHECLFVVAEAFFQ